MIRSFLILSVIFNCFSFKASDFEKKPLCSSFFEASKDESKRTEFHNFLDEIKSKESAQLAYLGAAKTLMAEIVSNPYSKYSYFKDGKELIERAVNSNPTNPEIRYVRFMIQLNTPDFLDYNDDLVTDFKIIKHSIENAIVKVEWMNHLLAYLDANPTDFQISNT